MKKYACYVMTPCAAESLPVNKETLRYKILSGFPVEEIKSWIEERKLRGEKFEEQETPDLADDILMVSVHRPEVLKMLLDICPANEEKLDCIGLVTDDAKNTFGKTALMYAVQEGNLDIAKYLVKQGADINLKALKGMSVYDYLSGKAPYFDNIREAPSSTDFSLLPPEVYENKNITLDQAHEFIEFLEKYKRGKNP